MNRTTKTTAKHTHSGQIKHVLYMYNLMFGFALNDKSELREWALNGLLFREGKIVSLARIYRCTCLSFSQAPQHRVIVFLHAAFVWFLDFSWIFFFALSFILFSVYLFFLSVFNTHANTATVFFVAWIR